MLKETSWFYYVASRVPSGGPRCESFRSTFLFSIWFRKFFCGEKHFYCVPHVIWGARWERNRVIVLFHNENVMMILQSWRCTLHCSIIFAQDFSINSFFVDSFNKALSEVHIMALRWCLINNNRDMTHWDLLVIQRSTSHKLRRVRSQIIAEKIRKNSRFCSILCICHMITLTE